MPQVGQKLLVEVKSKLHNFFLSKYSIVSHISSRKFESLPYLIKLAGFCIYAKMSISHPIRKYPIKQFG